MINNEAKCPPPPTLDELRTRPDLYSVAATRNSTGLPCRWFHRLTGDSYREIDGVVTQTIPSTRVAPCDESHDGRSGYGS